MLPALMSLRFLLAGLGITREPRLVAGTAVSVGVWRVGSRVAGVRDMMGGWGGGALSKQRVWV